MFGRDVRRRPVELSGAREARSVLPVSSCPVPTWTTTQHLCICAYLHSCVCVYFICVFVELRICAFVARPMVKLSALLSNLTAPHLVPQDQIGLKNCDFAVFWEPIGQPSKHLKGLLGPPTVTKNLHFLKRVSWDPLAMTKNLHNFHHFLFFVFDVVFVHLWSIIVSKMIYKCYGENYSFWPSFAVVFDPFGKAEGQDRGEMKILT